MIKIKDLEFGQIITNLTINVSVNVYFLLLNNDDSITISVFDEQCENLMKIFPKKYTYSVSEDLKRADVTIFENDEIYTQLLSCLSKRKVELHYTSLLEDGNFE
jgi:hypothetical protein